MRFARQRHGSTRQPSTGRAGNGRRKASSLWHEPGAGPIWARYYQIDTEKPIFADRNKTIHDDVSELSRERRNGYAWYTKDPLAALERFKQWNKEHPETK